MLQGGLSYTNSALRRKATPFSRNLIKLCLTWPGFFRLHLLSLLVGDDNMIRTQISLDEREYDMAKKQARVLGISVAEFVRRAVREALPYSGQSPWMKFAGLVETGDPHSSQSVDELVYGHKD